MILPVVPLGVVLAGGASSRMGSDKATLLFDGLTLVEHAARKLASVCSNVVVADGGRGTAAGFPAVGDGDGKGPVAGILGAAAVLPECELLVLACDLPMVPVGLLTALSASTGTDWVVPRWERGLEPLAALYRPAALTALRARATIGGFAPRDLAAESSLAIRYFEGEALAGFGPAAQIFFNLNQPDDLRRLETLRADTDAALHPHFPEG